MVFYIFFIKRDMFNLQLFFIGKKWAKIGLWSKKMGKK